LESLERGFAVALHEAAAMTNSGATVDRLTVACLRRLDGRLRVEVRDRAWDVTRSKAMRDSELLSVHEDLAGAIADVNANVAALHRAGWRLRPRRGKFVIDSADIDTWLTRP
jgi:hypothetical protein